MTDAETVVAELNRAHRSWEALQRLFASFTSCVADLGQDRRMPCPWLKPTEASSDRALFECFGRKVLLTLELDRKNDRGVIHTQDVTKEDHPATVSRISFSTDGDLGIAGGYTGRGFNLTLPADCRTIAFNCIRDALDQVVQKRATGIERKTG